VEERRKTRNSGIVTALATTSSLPRSASTQVCQWVSTYCPAYNRRGGYTHNAGRRRAGQQRTKLYQSLGSPTTLAHLSFSLPLGINSQFINSPSTRPCAAQPLSWSCVSSCSYVRVRRQQPGRWLTICQELEAYTCLSCSRGTSS
jgi:hypothetical protein